MCAEFVKNRLWTRVLLGNRGTLLNRKQKHRGDFLINYISCINLVVIGNKVGNDKWIGVVEQP